MQGKTGMRLLTAGLLTGVIGGGIFGAHHFYALAPVFETAGYVLMAAGGAALIGGFLLLILALRDPAGVHAEDAGAAGTALIRCMAAMSIADGQLDTRETALIARIYEQLTGEPVDHALITEIAETMTAQQADIKTELARAQAVLTADLKTKIMKASFYILAADGIADTQEKALLKDIRKGLGLSHVRYAAIKQNFLKNRTLKSRPARHT